LSPAQPAQTTPSAAIAIVPHGEIVILRFQCPAAVEAAGVQNYHEAKAALGGGRLRRVTAFPADEKRCEWRFTIANFGFRL
jgi:hypothetical protein